MNIIIFGAGRIGQTVCIDLSAQSGLDLTIVDKSEKAVASLPGNLNVNSMVADVSEKESIFELLQGQDLVVNALPGRLGFRLMSCAIEAGLNLVDVSFFPEDPLQLDDLAKDKSLQVMVDCGVAPGLSNLLVGHAYHTLTAVEKVKIYVGGLPKERRLPWEFASFFSPEDIVEEYIRPARIKQDQKIIVKPALSELEYLDFPQIGTLEAFLTDGLRTLLYTLDIPNLEEKTLRYPGHQKKIKFLQDIGFFEQTEVECGAEKIIPISLTTQLLIKVWSAEACPVDYTVMKIEVVGNRDGQKLKMTYDLVDEYDPVLKLSSMSRTTGYTTAACVNLLKEGILPSTGVIPLEIVGQMDDCYSSIIKYLEERNILVREHVEEV
ncbi:MAG TPA: saccharopine dehydrogenase [Candidatus Aminicenantes bacterium]|nr:saccharopine dehydrogenase [Candidatus Aminicenantes bacterium]